MRFRLIDRVIEVSTEPGEEAIRTLKQVSLAEEYLADHFPTFPVLPGVLMVEAMTESARMLAIELGADGRLVLGSARAIKFGSFVAPGENLELRVGLVKRGEGVWSFKGEGLVEKEGTPRRAVSGRLELREPRLV